jgi:ABC-type glycerol-3-phosphate transport system substrate-binding protein
MNRNMSKSFVIASLLVIASLVLAACGPAAAPAAPTTAPAATTAPVATTAPKATDTAAAPTLSGTITVLSNRTDLDKDGTLAKYSAAFAALYPGVTVKWETMTDYAGEMQTRMNTTDYGDVLLIPPALTADKFANFLTPLGTAADLGKKYMFIPSEGTYNGTVYGISVTGNGQGLVYNKDVFKAAGITALPKTPDEFQADLKLIKDKTQAIPLYTNYKAGWTLTQWDSQIESVSGDPDFKNIKFVHMDAPFAAGQPSYVVYKVLYDAVKAGYTEKDPTTTDWEKSKVMLANGEIAVMALGSWAISQMQGAATTAGKDPAIIGYMPFPTNVNGKQYAGAGGDYKMAINKNSKNQAAAQAFVTWFLEKSNFGFDQGGIPPLVGAKLPPQYDDFSKAGVIFVSDTAAKAGEEGFYTSIDKKAEIGFANGSGLWQSTIVDAARGQTQQTFDDIMNAANTKWAAARKALGVTP